ncbi:hypothetical protein NQ315_011050 [Exocentrus adspersus]|uniref:ZAD domain-containing protein n=1 Tax=Exocentrus adspersus TaxID=1586481 RepID=A0AAV8V9B9_9CUCU|nr:hypothetical protein NQ315_011050 [Exocentrus adspersus]
MEIFNKQPLCMLCLDIINESFKMIIDKFTEYASDTVFKQVFDDDSKTGICSGCSAKLYAALQFRLTCINIESTIIPYIDDEGEFPAEIKKIFLKYRKTDMALIDSEDNNIQELGQIMKSLKYHQLIPVLKLRICHSSRKIDSH